MVIDGVSIKADSKPDLKSIKVTSKTKLLKSIKKKKPSTIIFVSDKEIDITIPNLNYSSNKTIVIDAPDVSIKNYSEFKSVILKSIKKYNELSLNNTIIVSQNSKIEKLTCEKKKSQIKLITETNASGKIFLNKRTILDVSGEADSYVEVVVNGKRSSISTEIPITVYAKTDIGLTMNKGSERSKIFSDNDVKVKMTNKTSTTPIINNTNELDYNSLLMEEELDRNIIEYSDPKYHRLAYSTNDFSLNIFDSDAKQYNSHLKYDSEYTYKDSKVSAKWENMPTNSYFELECNTSLRQFGFLSAAIYSEKNTGSEIVISINCQRNSGDGKIAYYYYSFKVDWEGWKYIEINLADFKTNYNPNPGKVSSIVFSAKSFGNIPDIQTVLHFNRIDLIGKKYIFNLNSKEIEPSFSDILAKAEKTIMGNEPNVDLINYELSNVITKYNETELPFDADMTSVYGMLYNYRMILSMAKGFVADGKKDTELLKKIKRSLYYMHDHYYSDKTLHKFDNDNWYVWQISAPTAIVNTLLLLRNDFTENEIRNILDPVDFYCYLPTSSMANRVEIAYCSIVASALEKDYERLVLSRERVEECFEIVEVGDGFYEDGSFIQHDYVPYTGDYGLVMIDGLSEIIFLLNDTCFSFSDDYIISQYKWVFKSFVPFIFHGAVSGSVRGRAISIDGWSDIFQGMTAVRGLLKIREYVRGKAKENITSLLSDWCYYNRDYYEKNLDTFSLELLSTIPNAQMNIDILKYYPCMDRFTMQQSEYMLNIALSSSRIAKYEAINNENCSGWYTGEGMVYLYTTPDDYNCEYWKDINKYHLPGTTVSDVERDCYNINCKDTLTNCEFVGGLVHNNTAIIAMTFNAASENMTFNSDLSGNKAWFILENIVFCLGNSITATDDNDIITIIENRRVDLDNIKKCDNYIFIPQYGWIYIYDISKTIINNTSTGFVELLLNHGKKPKQESYEYVIIPDTKKELMNIKKIIEDIRIRSNTSDVTLISNYNTNTDYYVFWGACECDGVQVSHPCVLAISEKEITIADPSRRNSEILVLVNDVKYEFVGLNDGLSKTLTR